MIAIPADHVARGFQSPVCAAHGLPAVRFARTSFGGVTSYGWGYCLECVRLRTLLLTSSAIALIGSVALAAFGYYATASPAEDSLALVAVLGMLSALGAIGAVVLVYFARWPVIAGGTLMQGGVVAFAKADPAFAAIVAETLGTGVASRPLPTAGVAPPPLPTAGVTATYQPGPAAPSDRCARHGLPVTAATQVTLRSSLGRKLIVPTWGLCNQCATLHTLLTVAGAIPAFAALAAWGLLTVFFPWSFLLLLLCIPVYATGLLLVIIADSLVIAGAKLSRDGTTIQLRPIAGTVLR
jgi:hypothetical protein